MTPREIIAEAWAITTKEISLRRWAFTTSILETLRGFQLISFQMYFLYEFLFGTAIVSMSSLASSIYSTLPIWVSISGITIFGLLLVIEFFVPHVCLGAIIGLGGKAHQKQKVKGGLVLGLYNFFPIFAIQGLLILSSTSTIISACSIILRYVDGSLQWFSLVVVLTLFVLCAILKFFFNFAEEAVVLEKYDIFAALGKSFKLIISNLSHIVFLLLLLLVISLRIVINAIITILIPAIIIGLGLALTSVLPAMISYSNAMVAGLALIIAASYFFAYIIAFKQNVWTITYLELSKNEDLDVVVRKDEEEI